MSNVQYLSKESFETLKKEYVELKSKTILEIAKRIDEAKQQGDLSENAEYHQAREDMSFAQGRLAELEQIINNAQIISSSAAKNVNVVTVGNTVKVKINGSTREYTIVGSQEVNPANGFISNESPIGEALLGHEVGDKVEIMTPAGKQIFKIEGIK